MRKEVMKQQQEKGFKELYGRDVGEGVEDMPPDDMNAAEALGVVLGRILVRCEEIHATTREILVRMKILEEEGIIKS